MANRIAGILALIAFAMCLLVGAFDADNPFGVAVWRALVAMFWTYVVGYIIGLAAERMVSESLAAAKQRLAVEKKVTPGEESATDGR